MRRNRLPRVARILRALAETDLQAPISAAESKEVDVMTKTAKRRLPIALLLLGMSVVLAQSNRVEVPVEERVLMLERDLASLETRFGLRDAQNAGAPARTDVGMSVISRVDQLERQITRLESEVQRVGREAQAALREASQARREAMGAERLARDALNRVR